MAYDVEPPERVRVRDHDALPDGDHIMPDTGYNYAYGVNGMGQGRFYGWCPECDAVTPLEES